MGAVRLRGSAWILPETPETTERFQWLVQEIQSFRGEATLLHVERVGNITAEQMTAVFHKARAAEYQAVAQVLESLSTVTRSPKNEGVALRRRRGVGGGFFDVFELGTADDAPEARDDDG